MLCLLRVLELCGMAAAAAAEQVRKTARGGYCEGVLCLLCVLEPCGTAGAAAEQEE